MPYDKNATFRELSRKDLDMSMEEKKRLLVKTFTNEALISTGKLAHKDFLEKCLEQVDIQTLKENRDFFVGLFNDAGIGVPEYLERGKEIGDFENNIVTVLFLNDNKDWAFLHEYFPNIAPIIDKALAQKYKNQVLKQKDEFKTMTEKERDRAKILLNRAMILNPNDGDVYGYFAKLEESGRAANLNSVTKYYKMAYEITKKQEWKWEYYSGLGKVKQYTDELNKESARVWGDLQNLGENKIVELYNSIVIQIDCLISLGQYDIAQDRCDKALRVIKMLGDYRLRNIASMEIEEKRRNIRNECDSKECLKNDEIENLDDLNDGEKTKRIKELTQRRNFKLSKLMRDVTNIKSINNYGIKIANLYEQIGIEEKALEMYDENIQKIQQIDNWIQYNDAKTNMIIDNMCRKARVLNYLSQKSQKDRDKYKQQEIEEYTKILKMASLEDRVRASIIGKKINALMDIGDNENALKECDYALSLYEYRNEPEMLSKKATILLNMGNKEEALYVYMTMAAVDTSNKEMVEILSMDEKTLEMFKRFNDSEVDVLGEEKGTLKDIKIALAKLRNSLPDNSLERAYINRTIHKFNVCIKEGRIKDASACVLQISDVIKSISSTSEAILTSKRNVLDYIEMEQYKDLLGRLSKEQIRNQTLQIINQASNNLYGQVPIAILCANIFTVLNQRMRVLDQNEEDYQIHKQSQDATLECIIKDKREVYYKNLSKLKPNNPKSFIIAPIISNGHLFSTLIYKTTKGYDCFVVNKGEREEHLQFEKYSFLEDKIDDILDIVGIGQQKRFPIEKIYEIFEDNAYSVEKITDIEAREQVVGNCFEKEIEEVIKFSNALILGSYEKRKVPKFDEKGRLYISQVKVPKWPESTQDIHVKMLQCTKECCEDEEVKRFIDETIKMYTNNKRFNKALKRNRDMSNEQKKELFIKLFNPQATINIKKLNDINFLKECLKTVNLRALKENRDFFAMLLEESKIIVPEFMKIDMEFIDFNNTVVQVFSNGENSRRFLREYFPAIAKEVDMILVDYYDEEIDDIEFEVDHRVGGFWELNKGKIQQVREFLDREIELGCYNALVYFYRAQLEDMGTGDKDLNLMCNYYKRAYEISREPYIKEKYNRALQDLKDQESHKKMLDTYKETEARYRSQIKSYKGGYNLQKLEELLEYNIKVMKQASKFENERMIERSYNDAKKILGKMDDEQINKYDGLLRKVRLETLFECKTNMMQKLAKAGDWEGLQKKYNETLKLLKKADGYGNVDDYEWRKYIRELDKINAITVFEYKINSMDAVSKAGNYEKVGTEYNDALYQIEYAYKHGHINVNEKAEYQDRLYLTEIVALKNLKDANSPLRNVKMSKGVKEYKRQLDDYEKMITNFKAQNIDASYIINVMEVKADILNVLGQIDKSNLKGYKESEIDEYNEILSIIPKEYPYKASIINNKIDALVNLGRKQEAIRECDHALKYGIGDTIEILAKKVSILGSQELSGMDKVINLEQQLNIYKRINVIAPNNREIKNRIIDTHNKLITLQNKLYLEGIIQAEKEILNIQNLNKRRIKAIEKLKNIFRSNGKELSISQAKQELEGVISYYDGVSSVLLNKIIQTRQDTNIWDSNNTIVKCMESIYSSLSNFINVIGQQVSDHEYSEMLDKLSRSILKNSGEIDKCNKAINAVCNQIIDDCFEDIDNVQSILGQQQEVPRRYDFVITGDGNITRKIAIMLNQINDSIGMGIQKEMLNGLESLLKLAPTDLVILNGKAIILEEMGDKKEALKVYKEMMERAPNILKIKEKVKKLSGELNTLLEGKNKQQIEPAKQQQIDNKTKIDKGKELNF